MKEAELSASYVEYPSERRLAVLIREQDGEGSENVQAKKKSKNLKKNFKEYLPNP